MGGFEFLLTGLNNLDKFAWIGAFSPGALDEDFAADFPTLESSATQKFICCGLPAVGMTS